MFRFTIRDVLWLTVVVGMAIGWWRDHRTVHRFHDMWVSHVIREHSDNPNDYKRLIEREGPRPWFP